MGIEPEPSTPLPSMVDELCAALGLQEPTPMATAARAAAPSAAPIAATPVATSKGKQKPKAAARPKAAGSSASEPADDFLPPPAASQQGDLTKTDGIHKFLLQKEKLKSVTAQQDEGDAVPFEEVAEEVGLE
eukprot:2003201-Prymnesium_polylepis.1